MSDILLEEDGVLSEKHMDELIAWIHDLTDTFLKLVYEEKDFIIKLFDMNESQKSLFLMNLNSKMGDFINDSNQQENETLICNMSSLKIYAM